MIKETPVIVKKTTRNAGIVKEFSFAENDVRTKGVSAVIKEFRERSWAVYKRLSFPTTSDDPWRRTDLKNLKTGEFQFFNQNSQPEHAKLPDELLLPLADDTHAGQIIVTPYDVKLEVDPELAKSGVIFSDLQTVEKEHPEILEKYLGSIVKPEGGKFAAMAYALARNGVILYVPRNVVLEKPIHSIVWVYDNETAYFSNILVVLEEGASATFIQEYASPDNLESQIFHAGTIEVRVGENANFKFVELQSFGKNVWNVMHERVVVEQNGQVDWIFGAIGGHLTKNFADLNLVGRGSQGKMSGFYFTDGDQHLDYDSQQNHLAPNTTSDLLFKGALVENSRSVWQGMIYVAPNAMKTDGYQANRNLLLSKNARADSIPGLEILANDVRCTHGATVGKVDMEQVFYLESRGIPKVEAEKLIVEGFFDPIMQRIPFEGVKNRFQSSIHKKMSSYRGE
ncbi:MAG: Fe-S cluster assembly protein SufD [Anaerolineaceae bacterium]